MDIKYIDTGIEWLPRLPSSWKIYKVKNCFYISKEKAKIDNPIVLKLARDSIQAKDVTKNEGQMAASYFDYNPVIVGDLVINPMDLYSGANCNVSEIEGVISPAYINLRKKIQLHPKFFDYYFKHQYWTMAMFAHGKGVSFDNRWTINSETMLNYKVPFPPLKAQEKIVNRIDKDLEKTDKLIKNQQQQIEKLKEYKQSLISEVVTKGLDSNVKLKDSGIDWIGKIPVHWNIVPLKYSSNITMGQSPKSESYNTEQVGKPFLGGNSDIMDGFSSPKYYTTEITKTCKKGDILMSVRAPVGTIAKSLHDAVLGRGLCSIKSKISNEFMYFYMCFLENKWNEYITGTTFDSVNADDIKNMPYVLAPADEILHLLEYMNNKIKLIDRLIKIMVDKVVCLNDYKKSLIYEYVTGKKEVS